MPQARDPRRRLIMSAPCIIAGQLVDAKNIGVTKSLRLIIDVPQEKAMEVLTKLGWPTMANPIPVAIARLNEGEAKETVAQPPREAPAPDVGRSGRAQYARQSGILCKDVRFQTFVKERMEVDTCDEGAAKDYVRRVCDVTSRSQITP